MSVPKRRRWSFLGLAALGVALLLAALWIDDAQSLGLDRVLSDSLSQTLAQSRQASLVASVRQFLEPQAVLIDGRRGALLESLGRAADAVGALAAPTPRPKRAPRRLKPAPADPETVLRTLAVRARQWTSAVLTDKSGRVVAVWPLPQRASWLGLNLGRDPYFLALSDPSMGPGIVRHAYAPSAQAKGAADLVAACGVGDPTGAFVGLLKIHADVRRALLGADAAPFRPLLSAYRKASVLLVLGDGQEIYNNAKGPLSENLRAACGACPALLRAALADPSGSLGVDGYGGQATLAVWKRVGNAAPGASPSDVLSLIAFVPRSALGAAGPGPQESPRAFYERPLVLLTLVLALVLLLAALRLALGAAPALEGDGEPPVRALLPPSPPAEPAPEGELDQPGVQAPLAQPPVDEGGEAAALLEQVMQGLRDELALAQAALRTEEQEYEKRRLAELELRTQAEVKFKAQIAELRAAVEASQGEAGLAAAARQASEDRARDLARVQQELSKLEERLKAAEKTEGLRKEQEAVRLAAVNTLSGELKTTLEVIKNYINTLLGGPVSDGQQEFLGVVINKSARLERLIGDLVEISEIGSGAKPLRLESVACSSLVQDALVNARPQAENKNITLDFIESGAGQVRVDREKMGALLRGLLGQAVKVSPRNGKIALVLSERDASVELRITDAGMALSPERAAKVFVQFHGVDSQAGPEFIGTGLRFSLFKSVVEVQGGSISIESQAERGKTFVVVLPKASPAAPSLPAPLSPAAGPLAPKGLPPLGPPLVASAPASPTLAAVLPPPPALAPPVLSDPASPAPAKVVHKPAPLDESLNAPWKRKQVDEELGDWDLPIDPLPSDLKELPAVSRTAADTIDFEKVFGATPAGGPAKLESKAGAQPSATDLVEFSAIFGAPQTPSAAPSAPPAVVEAPVVPKNPLPSAPAPAPAPLGAGGLGADFDALFGPPSASVPLPPAGGKPAPPSGGLNTLDDLNELLGQ